MSDIPSVTVDQIPDGAPIVDVREPDEWAAGHIEGALHIPQGDLPARLSELPSADNLYIMCRSGGRSGRMTEWLQAQGINATNIDGGMRAWHASGKPMVADSSDEPTVI